MSLEEHIDKKYTDKQFCAMYEIDRRTAKRWRDKRLIGYIRTPTGKIRYLQRHIDAFDKRNEKKPRAA